MRPISVLFVCLGNICRSPMAEAVFRHQVAEAGLADRFVIDSAGTSGYHDGERPHRETQAELLRRGVEVGDQRSRSVDATDAERFDYVVAMDAQNIADLTDLLPADSHAEVSRLLDYVADADTRDVPDPWYEGGYDQVYELVQAGCSALLDHIATREGLPA